MSKSGRAVLVFRGDLDIDWAEMPARRQRLMFAVAARHQPGRLDWLRLYGRSTGLLSVADLPALLEQAERATHEAERERWTYLAMQVFRLPEHAAYVERARALPRFEAVLEARDAQRIGRRDRAAILEAYREERRREHALFDDEPSPRALPIDDALVRAAGDPHGEWWAVDEAMAAALGPRWEDDAERLDSLTGPQRSALVEFAFSALTEDTTTEDGGRVIDTAFALLKTLAPERLQQVSMDAWSRWTRIMLAAGEGGDIFQTFAEQRVREDWQAAWVETYRSAMDNTKSGAWMRGWLVRLEADIRSPGLEVRALDLLLDDSASIEARQPLLTLLLDRGVPEAEQFARSHADDPAVASIWLQASPDAAWAALWPRMQSNPEWGRALWDAVDDPHHDFGFARALSPRARAQLIWWLSAHFERPERPRGGMYAPTRGEVLLSEASVVVNWMVQTATSKA